MAKILPLDLSHLILQLSPLIVCVQSSSSIPNRQPPQLSPLMSQSSLMKVCLLTQFSLVTQVLLNLVTLLLLRLVIPLTPPQHQVLCPFLQKLFLLLTYMLTLIPCKPRLSLSSPNLDLNLDSCSLIMSLKLSNKPLLTCCGRKPCKREYDALIPNNTWTLVPLPSQRQTIGWKCVFRVKESPNGSVIRYKVRLVAKGFHQKHGFDFNETFSLVVKPITIRTFKPLSILKNGQSNNLMSTMPFLMASLM